MKISLTFIFLMRICAAFSQRTDVQDCSDANYRRILSEADGFFEKGLLNSAKLKYESLRVCRHDSASVVELKLIKVRAAIDTQTNKSLGATASYLNSEANKSFEEEDIRMAWRLTQAALKKDSFNIDAIKMRDTLPFFSAKIILNGNYTEKVSPDSSFWAYTTTTKTGKTNLYLLDLRTNLPAKQIGETYFNIDLGGIHYSPDSRFLIFNSILEDKSTILNLFEINKDVLPKQLHRCKCAIYASKFLFSPDNLFFTFTIEHYAGDDSLYILDINRGLPLREFPISSSDAGHNLGFSYDSHFLTFVSYLGKGKAAINILEVKEKKPPKTIVFHTIGRGYLINNKSYISDNPSLGDIISSKSYSPDSRFLVYIQEEENNCKVINLVDLYSDFLPRQFKSVYAKDEKFAFSSNSRFLSFVTINKKHKQTMNVLELDRRTPPKEYRNIYLRASNEFLYSPDGKFLCIMRNPKDKYHNNLGLSIINLDSNKNIIYINNVFNMKNKQIIFSPNSRFVGFITGNKKEPKTLNIVDLYGKLPLRQFPNVIFTNNVFTNLYDINSRFMAFISGIKEDSMLLNVLDLYSNVFPKKYKSVSLRRSLEGGFKYSPDGQKLIFLTKNKDGLLMFNIIKLDSTLNLKEFKCCDANSFYYTKIMFTSNSQFLSFQSTDGEEFFFNLIDLMNYSHKRFRFVNYALFEDGIISDNRYLVYKKTYNNEVVVLDLKNNKIVRKIYNQFKVYDHRFINKDYVIAKSQNPSTGKYILKLYYLPLGINYFEYYDKVEFLELSPEEKVYYNISN